MDDEPDFPSKEHKKMPKGKRGKPPEERKKKGQPNECIHRVELDALCNICRLQAEELGHDTQQRYTALAQICVEHAEAPLTRAVEPGSDVLVCALCHPHPEASDATTVPIADAIAQVAAQVPEAVEQAVEGGPTDDAGARIHDAAPTNGRPAIDQTEPRLQAIVIGLRKMALHRAAEELSKIYDLNREVQACQREHDSVKGLLKIKRERLDVATAALSEYIGALNTPSADLPLFDREQREADQRRMEAAAVEPHGDLEDPPPPDDATPVATEGVDEGARVDASVPVVDAPVEAQATEASA